MENIKQTKKENRGGKRLGAGRPKGEHETGTISFRIRLKWIDAIKELVKEKIEELKKNS